MTPGIDLIPAELIQDGRNLLLTEIYKLILFAVWIIEMFSEQWKESIILPICKKGGKD